MLPLIQDGAQRADHDFLLWLEGYVVLVAIISSVYPAHPGADGLPEAYYLGGFEVRGVGQGNV